MVCDLAETYHVYDYESLPVDLVATLVVGLRENSRLMMALTKRKIPLDQMISAKMLDALNFLAWTKLDDKARKRNKPKSIFEKLCGISEEKKNSDLETFGSGDEFMRYRNRLVGG